MKTFRFLKALSAAAAVATLLFSFSSANAQQHSLMAQHVPDLVSNGQASPLGSLDNSRHLQLALSLPLRNEPALDKLLADIYDPQSPNFHHYLSAQQFTDQFSPTQQDYDAVVAWAQAKGLQVTGTTPNRRVVDVDGSVANISRAFNVSMNTYQDNVHGRTFHAPDREPSVDLPVQLLAVSGLDDAHPPHPHYRKGDRPSQVESNTTETANAIAHIVGSGPGNTYLPSDMRKAYYGSGPLTGAGQTVAIFSYDGYIASDINLFYSSTGMTSTVPVNNVLVNGYNGACFGFNTNGTENPNTCDDGEQILDIVNVIGMAPGLTQVLFYEGNSATDILNKMASDNIAKVISSSWGGGDFGTASDPAFKEFQAQGQSYLNATGDSGQFNSSTYDPPSVDANITQVGGTDLTTTGAGGPWASETGWADSGGGFVSGTAIPAYQQLAGVINSSNKGSTTLRNAPDVAAEANFDNTTVIDGTFESGYGGTSYATPRWAGLIALANQQAVANGKGTLGFLNTPIYNIGVGSSYSTNFHDITSGNNKPSAGSGTGFNAVAGYDLVTGWGSPNGPTLIATLAGGSTATPDYSLSASPSSLSVAQGSSGTSTITVTGINSFSGSVSLTASGLPSGVTASFSPASATTTSTLTLTASSTATVGSATVTITGTSGSLVHTTTVALTITAVAAPNYSLSASPASLSVVQGTNGTSTVTVTKTGGFTGTVALTASGLPAGVTASFSPASTTTTSTLTLTAASTATVGSATVTITGTSGSLTHSTTVALTTTAAAGSPTQLLGNTGFESGTTTTPWTLTAGVICSNSTCSGETAHSGTWFAWLDGYGTAHTDTASQQVVIPAGKTTATLSFYLHIDTAETTKTSAFDTFTIQVLNTSGTVLGTLGTYSNLNAATGYTQHTFSMAPYIGQTVVLKFTGKEDSSLATSFVLDDVTLTVQ
jgi:subtilase family serine protease